MKVFITPTFSGADTGEGGIRRVVEAQRKWLPTVGVEVVDDISVCDVVAAHAVEWPRTDKPVVSHNHGLYWAEYEWENWALHANRAVIESIHKADAVTAVSQWTANAIARNTWIRPTVLYHGIDPAEWKIGTPKDNYVLWNKTRVDPICDPSPMQELARLAPDVRFLSTFGEVTENVSITGRLPYEKAKTLVRSALVYLCTSRETFGIGTLEAMAAGVPVLGFDWGGQREIITQGVDGWLVAPGDFIGLERGLRYIIEHRTKMGVAARKTVLDRFTWDKVIGGYRDVYEVVAAERASQTCKVTVVVPCYNLGQFLESAVRSVAEQEVAADVEVVIVDDASTDDSGAVADSLAGRFSGVRVIHNKHNQYLAGALNIGIAAANSPYVIPLDADNMLGRGALAALTAGLDTGKADIAYGAMSVIESSDGDREWQSEWPQQFDFNGQMAHKNQITSTAMYRKKLWARVGGYRRRCRTAEDADFWCRMTSYGAVAAKVTDLVVLRYRNREDSMSHVNADWPWNKWYPWWRDVKTAPPISPFKGAIRTYEPPRISVVIPVGPGHGRFAIDAVDSLVAQSFTAWEAIVVNDSGEPIPWIHPFVTVLDTGGKRGPAAARNLGESVARGSLILPLDADDFLQPNALQELYEQQRQLGGYVYSDWVIQETGEEKQSNEYDCKELLLRLPHAVTALYPKSAWDIVGGFDATLDAWEDWDFVIALAASGVCGSRCPKPLIQYRMSSGNRREELYARKDELVVNIRTKWEKYFAGGMELMACGGCAGRAANVMPGYDNGSGAAVVPTMASNANTNGELVLLEYVGAQTAPITYRGAKTGTPYRFCDDPYHKIKYVHRNDADALLQRGHEFIIGSPPVELLQAAGR